MGTWINKQIDWIKSFYEEESGKGSHKRLIGTFVVLAFIVPYFRVSIQTLSLTEIPVNWMIMIGTIIGLNIADYFVKGYVNKAVEEEKVKKDNA